MGIRYNRYIYPVLVFLFSPPQEQMKGSRINEVLSVSALMNIWFAGGVYGRGRGIEEVIDFFFTEGPKKDGTEED